MDQLGVWILGMPPGWTSAGAPVLVAVSLSAGMFGAMIAAAALGIIAAIQNRRKQ